MFTDRMKHHFLITLIEMHSLQILFRPENDFVLDTFSRSVADTTKNNRKIMTKPVHI